MNLTICNAARCFESCLKVLMLSTAVSDDLCYGYGLWVCFLCNLCVLRRDDKVDVQGCKNRVFYVCLDGTKWSSVYICCLYLMYFMAWRISDTFLYC